VAVAREGLETALFIYTNFKTVSQDTAPSVGLIFGLLAAILLGYLIYRRAISLNLGKFFTVTGIALLVVAAGVFSHGINEFQNFGALPGARAFAWNFPNDSSVLATIFDGTIGIGASITWLQLFLWGSYLALTLKSYLKKSVAPTRVG
jgi:high-affinity iron transporter